MKWTLKDYLEIGKISSRKWQTLETIDALSLVASRSGLHQLIVSLKPPFNLKQQKGITSSTRQLLYDRVRSIDILLEKLEKDQFINYTCLRQLLPEDDLFTYIQFINVIKRTQAQQNQMWIPS